MSRIPGGVEHDGDEEEDSQGSEGGNDVSGHLAALSTGVSPLVERLHAESAHWAAVSPGARPIPGTLTRLAGLGFRAHVKPFRGVRCAPPSALSQKPVPSRTHATLRTRLARHAVKVECAKLAINAAPLVVRWLLPGSAPRNREILLHHQPADGESGEAGHLHLVLHPNLPLEPEPFVGGRPVGGLLVTLAENEGVLGKGIR